MTAEKLETFGIALLTNGFIISEDVEAMSPETPYPQLMKELNEYVNSPEYEALKLKLEK